MNERTGKKIDGYINKVRSDCKFAESPESMSILSVIYSFCEAAEEKKKIDTRGQQNHTIDSSKDLNKTEEKKTVANICECCPQSSRHK